MRRPFKKVIGNTPEEVSPHGTGGRQVLLSKNINDISPNIEGCTKGYLSAGEAFDWHKH